jgi:hypothetical protein
MSKSLLTALDKLSSSPSNVITFAVQNVFGVLESNRSPPRDIAAAFKACVDCDDKVVPPFATRTRPFISILLSESLKIE